MFESSPRLKPEPLNGPGVVFAATDPAARADLSAALAAEGYGVWSVKSGLEAMSTFLEHTGEIDVLLLDTGLPDVRREAFVRRLQVHFPGMPCVFMDCTAPRSLILRTVRHAIAQGNAEAKEQSLV